MKNRIVPEAVVGALIFNQKNDFLLVKTHKWHGMYSVVGGHVEPGERMVVALKREIKEETGLSIRRIKFLRISEAIFDKSFWKKRHFIFIDFVCKTGATNVRLNKESEDFRWVSLKGAQKLRIEPFTRKLIAEYKRRFVGSNA